MLAPPQDVFSFGVLLWELMSRQVPWQGYDAVAVVHEVVERDARPPLPHSCPPDVADLIRACWLREPEARPPFSRVARHLAVLLDSAVGGV